MKKLTTALLAAAALTTAVSAEGGSNTGFYLGASAGVANTNVKYNFITETNLASNRPVQNFNNTTGKMAGLFGVFAGYGMVLGQGAYVGGEVYGGFDTTKVTPYDDSATTAPVAAAGGGYHKTTVKRSSFYGLAARVGYMITPSTLAYIRLGVEAGKWTMQVVPNQNGTAANISDATQLSTVQATQTKSKNSINFAPGLGFETYINKNLFVRAEYSYLFGPSITINEPTKGLSNSYLNGENLKNTAKISQHAFKIGVGYKF
jgi:opacity protein-like surface antigen